MNAYYLVTENGTDISVGRSAFWILLGLCIYFWLFRTVAEFPPTLYQSFIAVIVYNFGKKGVELFGAYFETQKGVSK